MAEETIFSKIIRKEIPANIVYQDELVTAFRDISQQAKTHILIIPNKVIPTVNDVTEQDEVALGRLFSVAAKLAKEEGIAEDGYRLIVNCNKHGGQEVFHHVYYNSQLGGNRLIVNCNKHGGQEVFHLHMHLVGGEPLGRMLAK